MHPRAVVRQSQRLGPELQLVAGFGPVPGKGQSYAGQLPSDRRLLKLAENNIRHVQGIENRAEKEGRQCPHSRGSTLAWRTRVQRKRLLLKVLASAVR